MEVDILLFLIVVGQALDENLKSLTLVSKKTKTLECLLSFRCSRPTLSSQSFAVVPVDLIFSFPPNYNVAYSGISRFINTCT